MERDFMGLSSKDTVVKQGNRYGCKEPDCFEAFNNYQAGETQSAHLMQLHHDTKPAVPLIITSPFFRPHFSGVPVTSPHFTGSFFGHTTKPWYGSKSASAPAKLTIFYGGLVNVYDGISPEKAQAIMFLAGNGDFVTSANAPHPRAQVHVPTAMTSAGDAVLSPMSLSSHPVGQLTDGPANNNEAAYRVINSLGQAMQSAIPQARKASLARFLEKRKERVMASAPYCLSKNTFDSM